MVLDHTKVVYTAEDEQGFTFRQINDEDAAVELRARRKKRNRLVLIAFVALLIGMVISTFFNFDGSDFFVCLVLCYSNIYSWSMRSDRECKYKTTEKKAGVTV